MKAKVIYDFAAQSGGELSVSMGEEVVIVDQNVGDGWWQATNAFGRSGLIPSTYVEVYDLPEPNVPPPAPPLQAQGMQHPITDDSDDDWDYDSDEPTTPHRAPDTQSATLDLRSGTAVTRRPSTSPSVPTPSESARALPLRRAFHRNFLRSGGEDYLLNQDEPSAPHIEAVIEMINGSFHWKRTTTAYNCTITSSKKDSKMKGIKSFIAYQLDSSLTTQQISRRYKHFDWLHARLVMKFPCVCIPPLPEKTITGRYEDDFVEERRKALQYWLNRMTNHPIVSQCGVFRHFLMCADVKKWKAGKREAEADRLQGGRFYFAVETKDPTTNEDYLLERAEAGEKFVAELERSIRHACEVLSDFHRKMCTTGKKEYEDISSCMKNLSKALTSDVYKRTSGDALSNELLSVATAYKGISVAHGVRAEAVQHLLDCLREFTGIFSVLPSLMSVRKSACLVMEEVKRAFAEGRLSSADGANIRAGAAVIIRSVEAELNWIVMQLRQEWMQRVGQYIREQARFYRQMADTLDKQGALFQS